jgi:hypothetical protein
MCSFRYIDDNFVICPQTQTDWGTSLTNRKSIYLSLSTYLSISLSNKHECAFHIVTQDYRSMRSRQPSWRVGVPGTHSQVKLLHRPAASQDTQPCLKGCLARRKTGFCHFPAWWHFNIQQHQRGAISATHQVCGPPSQGNIYFLSIRQWRSASEDADSIQHLCANGQFHSRHVTGATAIYPSIMSGEVGHSGALHPAKPHHPLQQTKIHG